MKRLGAPNNLPSTTIADPVPYDLEAINDVGDMIQQAEGDEEILAALKQAIPPDLWSQAEKLNSA